MIYFFPNDCNDINNTLFIFFDTDRVISLENFIFIDIIEAGDEK